MNDLLWWFQPDFGYFNIYVQDKFHAQLSWAWQSFIIGSRMIWLTEKRIGANIIFCLGIADPADHGAVIIMSEKVYIKGVREIIHKILFWWCGNFRMRLNILMNIIWASYWENQHYGAFAQQDSDQPEHLLSLISFHCTCTSHEESLECSGWSASLMSTKPHCLFYFGPTQLF